MQLGIEIFVIWQPRTSLQIEWADTGSKLHLSSDEWGLSKRDCKLISFRLGCQPTIDAFASRKNAVLPAFFSKCPQIGAQGVDFFAQDLKSDQVYWCTPPVSIIVKVVRHILDWDTPVCAILNMPEWHSAQFWPFMVKNDKFAPFIQRVAFTRPRFIAYNDSSNVFTGRKEFRMISCLIHNRMTDNSLSYSC